ncbi:hypothetical protein GGR57DRAFT_509569 [Xylariaceae sp. FL1272]|nr:hypothetical protein GGR57DRAFT_509569 [Xylariaceae sp. FL1272]
MDQASYGTQTNQHKHISKSGVAVSLVGDTFDLSILCIFGLTEVGITALISVHGSHGIAYVRNWLEEAMLQLKEGSVIGSDSNRGSRILAYIALPQPNPMVVPQVKH